ncbi:nuclear transport factor 2 family protein [Micromonospora sp. NPDC002296]|uniref:nuclear transport factor 2 family protein n=1 Tax=Micromonospora sp. NPDC002296 TaxID=3154271 RepID=UPI003333BEDF
MRRYYALVDAGDVDQLVALFEEDATYHRPGYDPMRGSAELASFYGGQRVIREGRHTVNRVLAAEDDIAVHGEFHGTLKDGSEVSLRFADFFVVAPDGRFSRRDTFFFAPLV